MNNFLEYKGFCGTVEYSAEDDLLHGTVIDLPNVLIMYDGKCLESLKRDFREAIDFYLLPDVDEGETYIDSFSESLTG